MPVVLLIGTADRFIPKIEDHFKEKYECSVLKDSYSNIRSMMANQEPNVLYIVPNLDKPERYEIFCLARKNSQIFVSLIDELNNTSVSSDKNTISMAEFDGSLLESKFSTSKMKATTANKRSKGVSFASLSDLKASFKKIRESNFSNVHSGLAYVFEKCEDRIIKSWQHNPEISLDEVEKCYKTMVNYELETKGSWV